MDIQCIVIVIGVILFSMTLHEAMHGFMAYLLGDDTAKHQGRLTLNPVKHIDPFMTILLPVFLAMAGMPIFGGAKPVQFDPNKVKYGEWGAALVALAGPLTNLLIAFLAFGVGVLSGIITTLGVEVSLFGQIVLAMVSVNLGFFVFNMLPIPPLDGSRVVYALAPDFIRRGMEVIERSGVFLVFALVLLFSSQIGSFMSGVINAILGFFMVLFGVK
ncbi:MAG TPA: site-2 protease family protein [Candidatus Saccharibacteria bacterium]|nr:site-2 protease family protein [Candidatus Saccharibacteria bacterium]HMR38475.1 site-2 protease family protein [Candidatus Saccharibacteria bacterium]